MNTNTEKNINEAIDWLQQVGGSVQDFAVEQAPLYCRELVEWVFWGNLIGLVIGLCMVAVAALLVWGSARTAKEDSELSFVMMLAGVVMAALGIIVSLVFGADVAKAKIAPRVVIMEHLRGLK